jgi:hypothetical protein
VILSWAAGFEPAGDVKTGVPPDYPAIRRQRQFGFLNLAMP